MSPTTAARVAQLTTMTVSQLRETYRETFGESTASRHHQWLVRRLAWRFQANEEGGLSERARARAADLARDATLRVTPPRVAAIDAPLRTKQVALPRFAETGLAPGTYLRRAWHGQEIVVTVLPNGFDYAGTVYRSLSAVARAVTGTQWNGLVFFGLKKQPARVEGAA